jgi:hypothetical protein
MEGLMTALQIIKMLMVDSKFKRGYRDLRKAMERLATVEQGLISYQTKYAKTMVKDWGRLPNDVDMALELVRDAYKILHPHRPMRNMRDAMERITEMAELEKAIQERKQQINQPVRK